MTREQWSRVKEIFGDALERTPSEREAFVRQAAHDDPGLLDELLRLVKESERESDLLSRPVLANARAVTREETPLFGPSAVLARRFRIIRFIARGGMGEVYEAEDEELGDRVALKAIRQRAGPAADLRSLFKREIQLARRVTHPNVCRIFDLAQHETETTEEPVLLLSMELIEGQTLTDYLKRNGPLTHASALPLIEEIAAGLQAVHDAGIIHGDLKPGNVMLVVRPGETASHARVMDFGMAFSAAQSGEAAEISDREAIAFRDSPDAGESTVTLGFAGQGLVGGTPDYLAPEQTKRVGATAATDVYAFALLIGEILGVPRAQRLAPTGEHMPAAWVNILRRCLSSDPARRYSRPADLAQALRSALERRSRLRRIALVAAASALTLLLAARRIDTILRSTANGLILTQSPSEEMERPSPDGKYLAGTSWDTGDLILRDVSNGKVRRLTHKTTRSDSQFGGAFSALFSPDGRHVIFMWAKDSDENEIHMIGVDGKGERTLYRAPPGEWPILMDCSPDGERILFNRDTDEGSGGLAILAVADGSVQPVQGSARQARSIFAADGRGLLFDAENPRTAVSEIRQQPPSGTESTLIGLPGSNRVIAWSPDRRRLIFSSDRRGQPGIWAVPVSDRGAEGEPLELVANSKGWEPLGISRGGSLFYRQDSLTIDVYTAALDLAAGKTASPPRRMTERFIGSYSAPNWSEDGRQLVFNSKRELPEALAIYDASTQKIRYLKPDLLGVGKPQWVEHGAAIMVTGHARNGPPGLYRVDALTGDTRLFRSGRDLETTFEGVWSRDGKFHYNRFADWRRGLFSLDIASGERRILYVPPPGFNMGLENLALSPDGRTLAFQISNQTVGTSSLMLIPAEGGAARPLFTIHDPQKFLYGSFTWTPDSQSVLVSSSRIVGNPRGEERASELWLAPVDGSAPRKIEFPGMGVMCLRLNPDGKTIAFHSRIYKSEIWVLEKFL
ncbi:MAG TPA: protein kinase [Bryobacteraceae bacterium]|nr:protein kinase [Bryobacteraceae bacterium]